MPQDPHALFDQAVMEMIEHSPIGAVPYTTSYAESLARLYKAYQAYPSADHPGGHVTARSLAGRPTFLAENLAEYVAGKIAAEALEPNAKIFDRYLASLPAADRPKAEVHRLKVTGKPAHHRKHHGNEPSVHHDPVHTLFLVPGCGPHHGLAGNYLYGSLFESKAGAAKDSWALQLHDCDDGASFFEGLTLVETAAKLQEILESAPFHLRELEALGFRSN